MSSSRRPTPRREDLGAVPERGDRALAGDADVAFASHHWPAFGTERIVRFLSESGTSDLAVTLTRPALIALLGGAEPDGVETDGDASLLRKLRSLTDGPDPGFDIVTP
jgi:alkyl sulfatase BDS1-like metallo-beta-lactamase superfamily hydrolase